ncbi:hypothetical protein EMIT093MI4_20422 [Pseudomonas sp. IT-93MI4]
MTDKSIVTLCVYDQGLIAVIWSVQSKDFLINPKRIYSFFFISFGNMATISPSSPGYNVSATKLIPKWYLLAFFYID